MRKHVGIAMGLVITACTQGGEAAVKPRSAKGQLELLQSSTGARDVNVPAHGSEPAALQSGRDLNLDSAVAAQCGLTPPSPTEFALPALLAAAAPVVIGWVIDYLVSQASSAAQKRVAEYSAVTAGGLQFGPPEATGVYRSVDPPTITWKCVRLTHKMPSKDMNGDVLAEEAIVKIEVATSQDSLLITPLRLYFDRPVARTGSSKASAFGVSVGLTFDALWQTSATGEGKTSRVWNVTALSQSIQGINWKDDSPETVRQRFYYYNVGAKRQGSKSDADNKPVQVPLIPWSVNRRAPLGSGVLTVTFAEAGDPPAILEFAAGVLKDHGKDISDFLKDAAKKAISPDAS